jgi:hypothetical protein
LTTPGNNEADLLENAGPGVSVVKSGPQQSGRANRLSSGSATMSMDLSVSMDVSRTHEESMDITGEPSGISRLQNETPVVEEAAPDATRRQQANQAYASNKRRKIVNSKLNRIGTVKTFLTFFDMLVESTELDDTLDTRVQMFKE